MSKKPYTPAVDTPPPGDTAALAKAKADTLAAEEAEADAYGVAQVGEAEAKPAPVMPERFTSGGATAEEIAAWKAEHGC